MYHASIASGRIFLFVFYCKASAVALLYACLRHLLDCKSKFCLLRQYYQY